MEYVALAKRRLFNGTAYGEGFDTGRWSLERVVGVGTDEIGAEFWLMSAESASKNRTSKGGQEKQCTLKALSTDSES